MIPRKLLLKNHSSDEATIEVKEDNNEHDFNDKIKQHYDDNGDSEEDDEDEDDDDDDARSSFEARPHSHNYSLAEITSESPVGGGYESPSMPMISRNQDIRLVFSVLLSSHDLHMLSIIMVIPIKMKTVSNKPNIC